MDHSVAYLNKNVTVGRMVQKKWVEKLETLDRPEDQERLIYQQEITPGLTVQDIGGK